MRGRKLGDILLARQTVTPEQLLAAIEQQSRMPMVRVGEALIALDLVTAEQLDEALEQQKLDRGVPIGELLVRLGASRARTCRPRWRARWATPGQRRRLPIEADALRRLTYATAQRLHAVPLMLRDGALIVALEDPSKRAALEEIEFACQCKAVPVLARHGDIAMALQDAYARIGSEVPGTNGFGDTGGLEVDPGDASRLVESLEREGADRIKAESERQIEQKRQLPGAPDQHHDHRGAQGRRVDIHIESYPGRDKLKIRFRKDGLLRPTSSCRTPTAAR
jgi:hypothetical protein